MAKIGCDASGNIQVNTIIDGVNTSGKIYDPNMTYTAGDLAVYDNKAWIANQDIQVPEVWDPTKWDPVNVQPDTSNLVPSDPVAAGGGYAIENIVYLTQAEYDALTPVDNTYYVIVEG